MVCPSSQRKIDLFTPSFNFITLLFWQFSSCFGGLTCFQSHPIVTWIGILLFSSRSLELYLEKMAIKRYRMVSHFSHKVHLNFIEFVWHKKKKLESNIFDNFDKFIQFVQYFLKKQRSENRKGSVDHTLVKSVRGHSNNTWRPILDPLPPSCVILWHCSVPLPPLHVLCENLIFQKYV